MTLNNCGSPLLFLFLIKMRTFMHGVATHQRAKACVETVCLNCNTIWQIWSLAASIFQTNAVVFNQVNMVCEINSIDITLSIKLT